MAIPEASRMWAIPTQSGPDSLTRSWALWCLTSVGISRTSRHLASWRDETRLLIRSLDRLPHTAHKEEPSHASSRKQVAIRSFAIGNYY